MINNKFEAYKLEREIKRSGRTFAFKRQSVNDYGEPIAGEDEVVYVVTGLYHESNSYVSLTTGDTTQHTSKKKPMVLCLFNDLHFSKDGDKITTGDYVEFGCKKYEVTGFTDVQNWGIVCDISLEVRDCS